MNIISYVLECVLEDKDSIGTIAQTRAGEVQRMCVDTTIHYSEQNALSDEVDFFLDPGHSGHAEH